MSADESSQANALSDLCSAAELAAAEGSIGDAAGALNAALALADLSANEHQRLAACGEAIAARLETAPAFDEATRTLLLIAAKTARVHSGLAGDWPGARRAEHRLARAHLAIGDTAAALRHARQNLELCEAGEAGEDERRSARELLERIRRATAE